MSNSGEQCIWNLSQLLSNHYSYALLLLNHSVTADNADLFRRLWCQASVRGCVDGGSNGYQSLIEAGSSQQDTKAQLTKHKSTYNCSSSTNGCHGEDGSVHDATDSLSQISGIRQQNGTSNHIFNEITEETNESYSCGKRLQATEDIEKSLALSVNQNRTKNYNSNYSEESRVPLPDFISGDFDSIDASTLQHYGNLGVNIVSTPDQNNTDFTKALIHLKEKYIETTTELHHVLVASCISHDRFDHVMANINTLHKCQHLQLSVPVLLLTQTSILFLLEAGDHKVYSSGHPDPSENWCGYIPCSGPTVVTTSGLKWDIENRVVEFGRLVSTSNQFAAGSCTISTDKALLFIMNSPYCEQ